MCRYFLIFDLHKFFFAEKLRKVKARWWFIGNEFSLIFNAFTFFFNWTNGWYLVNFLLQLSFLASTDKSAVWPLCPHVWPCRPGTVFSWMPPVLHLPKLIVSCQFSFSLHCCVSHITNVFPYACFKTWRIRNLREPHFKKSRRQYMSVWKWKVLQSLKLCQSPRIKNQSKCI